MFDFTTLSLICNPSLIMITETWCTPQICDKDISIDNYYVFRGDRNYGRGGGCAMYIRSDIKATQCFYPELITDNDSVWAILRLSHSSSYLIGCIYHPPCSTVEGNMKLASTFAYATSLPHTAKIICGDFNMPDVVWQPLSSPKRYNEFINIIETKEWQQHVQYPTRLSKILDLVFTNGIIPTTLRVGKEFPGSDHRVVFGTFNICTSMSSTINANKVLLRGYRHAQWDELKPYIRTLDWEPYFTCSSAIETNKLLYENLGFAHDFIAPVRLVKTRPKQPDFIPVKIRNRLRKHARQFYRYNDFSSLITLKQTYDSYKSNQLSESIKLERILHSRPDNTEALVKLIKSRINNNRISIPNLLLDGEKLHEDPQEICELFSSHFSSYYTIEETVDSLEVPTIPNHFLGNITFTQQKISSAIASLRTSYNAGPDGIPSILLKRGGEDIPIILLKFFILSLNNGSYPECWKLSFITPRHKQGPTSNIENYRPINITSVVSRVMEKVIGQDIASYLHLHKVFTPAQHGFLKNRSCSTCLLDYFDDVTAKRDHGLYVTTLFFDFKKAFDKVPHKRLILKLKSYGFQDPLLSWLISFLEDRSQVVKFANNYSSPRPIRSGVIQGSVLGPLLFVIYINDICSVIKHGTPYLFADDLKIVYSFPHSTLNEGFTHIQDDLDRLHNWSNDWQLPFNSDKCGVLYFNNSHPNFRLHLGNSFLQTLSSIKDLGVTYSQNLTFSQYAKALVSKCRRLTGLLHRKMYTNEAKVLLYKVMVRPVLEYCTIVFGFMHGYDRVRIENIQRSFTRRLLYKHEGLTYADRCKMYGLQPLWLRRLKLNLTFLFRLLHGYTKSSNPIAFNNLPIYTLRNHENTLSISRFRTKLRSRFFKIQYSALWNELPLTVRSCRSPTEFQRLLNEFLSTKELRSTYPYFIHMGRSTSFSTTDPSAIPPI
uniref:Reverse transcriptase domain-containing protein n=3 Tax=Trichobilharzia regenti TaxID=157069 RepID=A0AA85JDK7_TRIRE|nr:unnamed protein product [Trichobilharzia regenti]CAH8842674.1 unnamed protein product [Trichobilharzia regenti]CAH8867754.1 unnamed protein product [Trichobilharzia regenti]CAH8868500.1 unnamed protein product [Trichobilharzia regenti]